MCNLSIIENKKQPCPLHVYSEENFTVECGSFLNQGIVMPHTYEFQQKLITAFC